MNFYPFAVTSTLIASQEASSQQDQVMKLRVTVNGAPRAATLYDNATSRDLLKLLPLELTLQDYASAEKIAYLPRRLDTAAAPAGFDPSPGDLTYTRLGATLRSSIETNRLPEGSSAWERSSRVSNALNGGGTLKVTIEAVK